MKIIFSRKGFDSTPANGGVPSPIIDGEPINLPIPGIYPSETTYGDIHRSGHCLGAIVEDVTKGRYTAKKECHNDPMFEKEKRHKGRWAFGQVDGSQTHLSGEKTRLPPVGEGDIFLFFGLFAYKNERSQHYSYDKHHRIFGCLTVEENGVKLLGSKPCKKRDQPKGFSMPHPHVLTEFSDGRDYEWKPNNTLYTGEGYRARTTPKALRLTHPEDKGKTCSRWLVPHWLHDDAELRVNRPGKIKWSDYPKDPQKRILQIQYRWQECISGDISEHDEAQKWLAGIMAAIEGRA